MQGKEASSHSVLLFAQSCCHSTSCRRSCREERLETTGALMSGPMGKMSRRERADGGVESVWGQRRLTLNGRFLWPCDQVIM